MVARYQQAPSHRTEWVGLFLAVFLLAALLQQGSPGFELSNDGIWTLAKYFPSGTQQKIERDQKRKRGKAEADKTGKDQAIPVNVDIPNLMLGLYQEYGGHGWSVIAGVYKIESDHGRSKAPGVRSGVNSFGCCAGPGQFHIRNGPGHGIKGSTWDTWGDGDSKHVYDPRYSVPATAKMLYAGYNQPRGSRDYRTCSDNAGLDPRWVNALRHYNNACWYVKEVAAWVHTYAKAPTKQDIKTPNGLTFTTSHGCDPEGDFKKGILTPEVQGFMLKLARSYKIRISCGATGHSRLVKGTTRESAHWTGRAFDVDMVEGKAISPANPRDDFGRAALGFGAKQVGGPHRLCGGRRCFTNAGHQGHWHIQP